MLSQSPDLLPDSARYQLRRSILLKFERDISTILLHIFRNDPTIKAYYTVIIRFYGMRLYTLINLYYNPKFDLPIKVINTSEFRRKRPSMLSPEVLFSLIDKYTFSLII